jgi:hypothetical protein
METSDSQGTANRLRGRADAETNGVVKMSDVGLRTSPRSVFDRVQKAKCIRDMSSRLVSCIAELAASMPGRKCRRHSWHPSELLPVKGVPFGADDAESSHWWRLRNFHRSKMGASKVRPVCFQNSVAVKPISGVPPDKTRVPAVGIGYLPSRYRLIISKIGDRENRARSSFFRRISVRWLVSFESHRRTFSEPPTPSILPISHKKTVFKISPSGALI